MPRRAYGWMAVFLVAGLGVGVAWAAGSLAEARRGFVTHLVRREAGSEPVAVPPRGVLRIVKYRSPAGELPAYLTPPPADGGKHPAIVWLVGGFDNGIGDTAWVPAPADNDQSARAFREAGIVTLLPSLRGGHPHSGVREVFYGEVDDVLAAVDFLARQKGVDPQRIYLGGHSTGGTLALLVAESSARFRAVFAFGPVANVGHYGAQDLPFDLKNPRELLLRSPGKWLDSIQNPTFVLEGMASPSNLDQLQALARTAKNPALHFLPVPGASHFSTLAPITRLIAQKILADRGAAASLAITGEELAAAMRR